MFLLLAATPQRVIVKGHLEDKIEQKCNLYLRSFLCHWLLNDVHRMMTSEDIGFMNRCLFSHTLRVGEPAIPVMSTYIFRISKMGTRNQNLSGHCNVPLSVSRKVIRDDPLIVSLR